jgi:hypothetical protein
LGSSQTTVEPFRSGKPSRSGPGFHGRTGFVASWRPIHQNAGAIKIGGSPFKTFAEAEEACKAMLTHLRESSMGE